MSSATVTFSFSDKDHGWKKLIEMGQRVARDKPYAKAGVMARKQERKDGEIDNVSLAVIHEFGSPAAGIPERSFIRSAFDRNEKKYELMALQLVSAIYEGKTDENKALGLLGLTLATDIKLGITTGGGIKPPDNEATVLRKANKLRRPRGFIGPMQPRTLVDTGQLVGAISWVVVKAESEQGKEEAPE